MNEIDPHQLVRAMTDNGWRIVGGSEHHTRLVRPQRDVTNRHDTRVIVPLNPGFGDYQPLLDAAVQELIDDANAGLKAALVLGELNIDRPLPPNRRPLYVPDTVESTCDNTSAGVLVFDDEGRMLLFERVKPPVGITPPCGHIDKHGSAEDAARAETGEEVGLTVVNLDRCRRSGGWRNNVCRRHPGPRGFGHNWTVFHATVEGQMALGHAEAKNARWADHDEIQRLAARTVDLAFARITAEEYAADPGLEPVWVDLLAYENIVINVDEEDLAAVTKLANASPWPQP